MESSHVLESLARRLRNGAVGVLGTDTVYGLVAAADNADAVERIFALKGRDGDKPLIILIGEASDLASFGIVPTPAQQEFLAKAWPGKVSVVFPAPHAQLEYLHRGRGSIAFRLPDNPDLRALLKLSGPLASSSANLQGQKVAETMLEAQAYFSTRADFYHDAGSLPPTPSTLVDFDGVGGAPRVLRQGAADVSSLL